MGVNNYYDENVFVFFMWVIIHKVTLSLVCNSTAKLDPFLCQSSMNSYPNHWSRSVGKYLMMKNIPLPVFLCMVMDSDITLRSTGLEGHICPSLVRDWKDIYVPLL